MSAVVAQMSSQLMRQQSAKSLVYHNSFYHLQYIHHHSSEACLNSLFSAPWWLWSSFSSHRHSSFPQLPFPQSPFPQSPFPHSPLVPLEQCALPATSLTYFHAMLAPAEVRPLQASLALCALSACILQVPGQPVVSLAPREQGQPPLVRRALLWTAPHLRQRQAREVSERKLRRRLRQSQCSHFKYRESQ